MSHWPLQINDRVTVKEPYRTELELRLPGTIEDIDTEVDFHSYLVNFEAEGKQHWLYEDQIESLSSGVSWPE